MFQCRVRPRVRTILAQASRAHRRFEWSGFKKPPMPFGGGRDVGCSAGGSIGNAGIQNAQTVQGSPRFPPQLRREPEKRICLDIPFVGADRFERPRSASPRTLAELTRESARADSEVGVLRRSAVRGWKTVQAELKKRRSMVGTGRFELPTPRTPSECSTRLSHVPTQSSRLG